MKNTAILLLVFLLPACQIENSKPFSNYRDCFMESLNILEKNSDILNSDMKRYYIQFGEKALPYYSKSIELKKSKESLFQLLDTIRNKSTSLKTQGTCLSADDLTLIKHDFEGYRNKLISFIADTLKNKETLNKLKKIFSARNLNRIEILKTGGDNEEKMEVCFLKLKADIAIAESEILNYLHNQIDMECFRLRNIEVFVVPNSKLLPLGIPYKAEIFLAAFDTTLSCNYEIENKIFTCISGIGVYRKTITGKPGLYDKDGNYLVKSPYTGEIQKIPFTIEYEILANK